MREFSPEYLRTTRASMWADDREALAPLSLDTRERVLDVGCGTGALTRVLREETPGTVVGLDADRNLLGHVDGPTVQGDALSLPVGTDAVDLAVCQALLINLPEPAAAVRELARASDDLVAAIEPDNAAVTVTSTVDAEASLACRARSLYLSGVETDVTLGAETVEVFEGVGLSDVSTVRYDHERVVEPPYDGDAFEAAKRKASGEGLTADRETMRNGGASPEVLDDLREDWRAMGRSVVEQMQAGEYRRTETVPFYVTVGRV